MPLNGKKETNERYIENLKHKLIDFHFKIILIEKVFVN